MKKRNRFLRKHRLSREKCEFNLGAAVYRCIYKCPRRGEGSFFCRRNPDGSCYNLITNRRFFISV
jgi:hypothetical protein